MCFFAETLSGKDGKSTLGRQRVNVFIKFSVILSAINAQLTENFSSPEEGGFATVTSPLFSATSGN
jgi:hypothetical protein